MSTLVPEPRRLSALLTNAGDGAFALACVESLQREWQRTRRMVLDLEIVLVDDASPVDQTWELSELARRGVRILRAPEPLGPAGAAALALSRSTGQPDDVVALVDPRVLFRPGSIDPLMDHLALDEAAGAVGPRLFIDSHGHFERAAPRPAGLTDLLGAQLARIRRSSARRQARQRLRRSADRWAAAGPVAADVLSGACLFLRRGAIARAGLLDDGCPEGFEHADLCDRLRADGWTVVLQPRASAVHPWTRAELARDGAGDVVTYARHGHGFGAAVFAAGARTLAAACPGALRDRPPERPEDLGALAEPARGLLPEAARFLLELSPEPTFEPAAWSAGEGLGWRLHPDVWDTLHRGHWWLRACDPESGDPLGAWTFEKTAPGRAEALPPDELAAELEAAWPLSEVG